MRVELIGAGASGVMAAAAGFMAHFGTTPEAVLMAGAGAGGCGAGNAAST